MKNENPQTLDDVCEFIVDCLHKTAPVQGKGYPSIRTPNVGRGRLLLQDVNKVSEDTYNEWTRRAVPCENDLILAREAPAGNIAIIKNGQTVCLGQRTVHLRPDPNQVDPDFLCYFLLAPPQQGVLLAGETGATAGHVNMRDIRRLPLVGLPDQTVQRKVGAILAAYDDLIENNRRRMALLEEAARQLYREWFVRLRFPGHEHTRITNGVPEGWENIYLGDVCDTQYGYTETATDVPVGPKFLRGTDINKTPFIDWSTVPYCPIDEILQRKYQLRVGDIVIIRMADPGKVAIIERDIDAVFASYLIRLIPTDPKLTPYYLYYVLTDDAYQGFVSGVSTGSTRKTASAPLLVDYYLLLPPQGLLQEFEDSVRLLRQQTTTLLIENEKARVARDLLLPRLMSGEIAV